jgi:hypothetical protein
VLVVVQFTVSITLTISTLIVYRQVQHAKNRPVGYSQAGLLLVEKKTMISKASTRRCGASCCRTGAVYEVAESRSSVTGLRGYNGGFSWKGKELLCPRTRPRRPLPRRTAGR